MAVLVVVVLGVLVTAVLEAQETHQAHPQVKEIMVVTDFMVEAVIFNLAVVVVQVVLEHQHQATKMVMEEMELHHQ
jgi:hypothetical protein